MERKREKKGKQVADMRHGNVMRIDFWFRQRSFILITGTTILC